MKPLITVLSLILLGLAAGLLRVVDVQAKEISSLKAQLAAPKPEIKESALTLESTMAGNISVFFVKKSDNPLPQFRKLKNFITAARSFSQASGAEILSITPVGECAMIDGEPAYQSVVVTHTKPFTLQ